MISYNLHSDSQYPLCVSYTHPSETLRQGSFFRTLAKWSKRPKNGKKWPFLRGRRHLGPKNGHFWHFPGSTKGPRFRRNRARNREIHRFGLLFKIARFSLSGPATFCSFLAPFLGSRTPKKRTKNVAVLGCQRHPRVRWTHRPEVGTDGKNAVSLFPLLPSVSCSSLMSKVLKARITDVGAAHFKVRRPFLCLGLLR